MENKQICQKIIELICSLISLPGKGNSQKVSIPPPQKAL